ncbi:hypothetical protein COCNU_11G005470 [Cocos nucifera]|uniref:Uncharacterized protein n=1 Tax=Cocos nucifera TaxID=13894 RepID=A0A8K0IPG5_COCNU|nr:hypothetical protein COCNU_11G005470 [Cocos nucifera]
MAAPPPPAVPVKLEIEDPLDEQHGPLNKRSKSTAPLQQANLSRSVLLFGFSCSEKWSKRMDGFFDLLYAMYRYFKNTVHLTMKDHAMRHFVQCSQGLLSKHIEKLIQCDPRLYALSQQPNIILENPYFESRCSVFEDQVESECHGFGNIRDAYGSPVQGFQESGSPCSVSSISTRSEAKDPIDRTANIVARDTHSPSSVMDTQVIEENATRETEEFKDPGCWDQFKVPGIQPSMSVSDLVNHIGHCISEQINSGNPLLSGDNLPTKDVLEEITQYLLSDSQILSSSDEKSLMSRVNSFCCLIQKDAGTGQSLQINNGDNAAGDDVTGNASKPGSTSERKPLFDFPAT